MKPIFKAEQFIAARCYTVEEKARFANALARFVLSGFRHTTFSVELYHHLSCSFGHIAHYDRSGFYNAWFYDEECRGQWVGHVLSYKVVGDPKHTLSDVEKAFKAWLAAHAPPNRANEEREKKERAELRRLFAKYPDELNRMKEEASE